MPYSSVADLPKEVKDKLTPEKQRQFREVFNSVYADTKDEGKAMAAAYSAVKKSQVSILKAQYATDIFTTEGEAKARSMDMGLDGVIHVSEYDGQAVFMPAESHEAYLAYYTPETQGIASEAAEDEPDEDIRLEALRVVIQEIMKEEFAKAEYQGEKVTLNKPRRTKGGNKKFEVFVQDGDKVKRVTFGDPNMEIRRDDPKARANFRARHSCDTAKDKTSARYWSCRAWEANTTVSELTKNFESYGEVTKVDAERRIVYGYASVISKDGVPIVDRQGDIISADELEKAASDFMLGARFGKTMHKGDPTTTIIHSFPMTDETKKAYNIESPYEAWLIAVKVHDDETWEMVKSGNLKDFSIGGAATRREV